MAITDQNPSLFEEIKEAFERALGTPKGIRIPCANRSAATRLRHRFNRFRKLDRQDNAAVYPAGHPLHKRSVYDNLCLRIPPKGDVDETFLYIEPHILGTLTIEEIE